MSETTTWQIYGKVLSRGANAPALTNDEIDLWINEMKAAKAGNRTAYVKDAVSAGGDLNVAGKGDTRSEVYFDSKQLDEFHSRMAELALTQIPSKCKSFLKAEAKKLRARTETEAAFSGIRHTGLTFIRKYGERTPYLRSIKSGKGYRKGNDGSYRSRVYSYVPHAHLLEYGHEMHPWGVEPSRGRARAFKVFENARTGFEPQFIFDTEKFIDKMLDEGLLG